MIYDNGESENRLCDSIRNMELKDAMLQVEKMLDIPNEMIKDNGSCSTRKSV